MKYVKEFGIILIVSLVGELLNYFLPLPVPASIYGLVLMFLCLMLGIIKLSDVHDTACFMAVSGLVTQAVLKKGKKGAEKK